MEFKSKNNFIMLLDSGANLKFINQYEGITSSSVKFDHHGDIIIVGVFDNTVDFDNGPGQKILTAQSTSRRDFFIQKINKIGDLICYCFYPN